MNACLADLLHDQLRDLYDAEVQYRRLLPGMIECATHLRLRDFLITAEEDAGDALSSLEEACTLLGVSPEGVECAAMQGLIREARRSSESTIDSATRDAALIANAQRVAHYEIAGFGTASAFARCLNASRAASLLSSLADAAGARDRELTAIAVGGWFEPGVNQEAATTAA